MTNHRAAWRNGRAAPGAEDPDKEGNRPEAVQDERVLLTEHEWRLEAIGMGW